MESILTDLPSLETEAGDESALFSLPADVLTKRQTEVITLYYKEGLVACEIAAALGITARTVRSIKFQALNRLRKYYGAATPLNEVGTEEETRRKVS
ncbi:hypothetical protein PSDVSF_08900 [Pseudodesulfovibrio sediminis]|uniref:RNA polymerase sigma-70 region 4 domain-containing protein n=2 Tax=Pseudodesulfovibrio sediminis TaxID=2810563 RepID=A0ABN6EQQ6_9BACT|nr:hypothetical protein PSDVSF_08900 [Pseudodesulfovibrio sediminis]